MKNKTTIPNMERK